MTDKQTERIRKIVEEGTEEIPTTAVFFGKIYGMLLSGYIDFRLHGLSPGI